VPPGKSVADVLEALSDEYVRESESSTRMLRPHALSVLMGMQSRVKLYTEIPSNGLLMFTGRVLAGGDDRRTHIEFEPFTPLNFFTDILCRHGRTFPIELLRDLFGPSGLYTAEQMEVDGFPL
jgi:peptide subunit release factor 1 (eRF1)